MMYLPAEHKRDAVAEIQNNDKSELGRFNIKDYYKDNQFDKNSFQQQCRCNYCNHSFNPFCTDSPKVKTEWVWRTIGKPEKRYTVECSYCSNEVRFILFIE